nr:unnamed protein product [Callosobruchus analis]
MESCQAGVHLYIHYK